MQVSVAEPVKEEPVQESALRAGAPEAALYVLSLTVQFPFTSAKRRA